MHNTLKHHATQVLLNVLFNANLATKFQVFRDLRNQYTIEDVEAMHAKQYQS